MKKIKKIFMAVCLACAFCVSFALSSCAYKNIGEFYSLEAAYDNGYITTDDLKNIACYQNGANEYEDFTPCDIGELDATTALMIRMDCLGDNKEYTLDSISIRKYYGTYNGYVAVMIDDYNDVMDALRDVTVGEVTLHYNDGNSIKLWKEKN